MLGEVWYAEADRPEGPWVKAKKIMTHDKYSFYNPKQHPQFTSGDGRYVFFEGRILSPSRETPILRRAMNTTR